jgi:hypothetical protein
VSIAKAKLPELRRAALMGEESIIKNDKSGQSEDVSLIATSLLDEVLSVLNFTHQWEREDGDEVWTLIVPEIDVFGVGKTQEEAIVSLVDTVQEYAGIFFSNLSMYLNVAIGRRQHYGYLRRIARCEGDKARIREVLGF